MRKVILSLLIIVGACTSPSWAINGDSLVLRSNGTDLGTAWQINDNGYLGTYIALASPGSVTLRVNAQGTAFGGIDPHMNIVVGDNQMGWDVTAGAANYDYTVELPAGTHFVRTEFNNDQTTSRALRVNTFEVVSGATLVNINSSTNALAAADDYVANYRKGNATVHMPAIEAGTQVQVKLKNHEFNFGIAIPNSFTDTFLIENPTPGSDAANYQTALADNRFNSMSPANGGKWVSNEGTRDVLTANAANPDPPPNFIPLMDRYMDYAEQHDMRFRQHNLIWGPNASTNNNQQQPTWAYNMMQNPAGIDGVSGDTNAIALRDEISERIDYYIGDRAQRYYEVDIYNESYHTGSNHALSALTYYDALGGVNAIAGIYKEAKDAAEAAGAGDVKMYVNEYSALQNQGGDSFANWYMRHIEDIQNAGQALYGEDVVTGIGVQYYGNGTVADHSASRIYSVFNNLAVLGQSMHLTEWGMTGGTEAQAATVLGETLRLVFGMPGMTGFTMWNLHNVAGSFGGTGALYNANWTTRDAYDVWQDLVVSQWDTDLTLEVGLDGSIDFTGFYGDYEITIGSETYDITLNKGDDDYILYDLTVPGDTDGDGDVDVADFINVKNNFGDFNPGLVEGDADGDGDVDAADLALVKSNYGSEVVPGPPGLELAFIPEPASLGLLGVGGLIAISRRRSV